jgi:hypothetical protein
MIQGSVMPFILKNHSFHFLCQSELQPYICHVQCSAKMKLDLKKMQIMKMLTKSFALKKKPNNFSNIFFK